MKDNVNHPNHTKDRVGTLFATGMLIVVIPSFYRLQLATLKPAIHLT